MFSGLRLRLTLLYLLAALALVALVGGGAYLLVGSYFQSNTDLALKHKLAEELSALGAPVPSELIEAGETWRASRQRPAPPERGEHDREGHDEERWEEAYDTELATIFTVQLNPNGQVLSGPGDSQPPFAPSQPVFELAMARGNDLRTLPLPDGRRVRVLTYRVDLGAGPAAVQVGRLLTDQDRVLKRLLLGLLLLGGVSAVLMGAISWWLAGRSLQPAQQAWERQRSFVANASHELRTPLTLLRASAEVALRGLPADDSDRRELLGDVLQESDHMRKLIEDLLLLSRLDAGQLSTVRERIPLAQLLAEIARQVGRLAEARGVQIVVEGGAIAAWGDPARLRQVLLILLDNALRYTPPGGSICLSAQPSERAAQISVADRGPGIAAAHLPLVFERFYRVDSSYSDEGGSGLGLSIAKALVEAQGGQIAVTSQRGRGTTVLVTLPLAEMERG